jgi:oxygen-independent coproporphyrinogen III oxidase
VARGLAIGRDDLVRRSVIMALMCQGEVQFESIELGHLIDFQRYFARELDELRGLESHGLVSVDGGAIRVTSAGWYLVRAVAMVFDRYLQADQDRARFSRVV